MVGQRRARRVHRQDVGAIVGIELTVERWEGKRKLSQNKSEADVAAVAADLATGNAAEQQVAAAMLLR